METVDKRESKYRRRSSRMVLRVPLLINAADSSAETQWEQVETVLVSLHGGMLRTHQRFPVGATLDIRMPNAGRSARARVAWTSLNCTPKGADLGFEILDDTAFWGLNFPPDRRSVSRASEA